MVRMQVDAKELAVARWLWLPFRLPTDRLLASWFLVACHCPFVIVAACEMGFRLYCKRWSSFSVAYLMALVDQMEISDGIN